jgi:two-component system, OmpR family, phosphate regulon sensor histidine kinase PhoR
MSAAGANGDISNLPTRGYTGAPRPGGCCAQIGDVPVCTSAYDLPLVAQIAGSNLDPDVDGGLLLEHAEWFCKLRWLVVAAMLGLALLSIAAGPWLLDCGIRLEAGWPLGVAAFLALANVAYQFFLRTVRDANTSTTAVHRNLWRQILVDLAVLTVVVHYLGSVETVAPLMVLFHIVLACIFFTALQSLAVTGIALAMYLLCVVLECCGLVPASSVWTILPAGRGNLPIGLLMAHVGTVALISITIWFLASRLAGALRQRDAELAATNRRLLAATEERARHMLQTTHQLKAPFAAIHANAQLLRSGCCGPLPAAALPVVDQIAARCELLAKEIKAMLQLANLRSSSQGLPQVTDCQLDAILRSSMTTLEPVAAKRGIAFRTEISPAPIRAVPDHAVMILDNVLANAVAYSHDGQEIDVMCRPTATGGAVVRVEDHGIGILAAKLPRIFDDYYRTADAARHNKASTGLGLAIVRQAALAGQVRVRVESEPGQGTAFTLDFPACWGEARRPL